MSNKLPQGWVECQLGEVFDIRDGTHDSPKYHDIGYPLVTSKNLKNGLINLENVSLISEKDYNKINERSKVSIGDVLFAMIGTIGNPVIVDEDPQFAIKNVALFKYNNLINNKYLKYFLESPKTLNIMHSQAKGSTQKFVGLGYLRAFIFLFCSLNEQRRIVEKIETEFAKIDEGLEHLKQTKEQIKQYRQSVLKFAFKGKLVSQNPDDESAEVLLPKINSKAIYRYNDKLPQGWVECQLEDILSNEKYSIKRGPFGSSLKKAYFVPSGIRVFEQYNPINNDPYWSRYYIPENKYKELEAFTAKAGDFLVSCSGTLGKILQLPVDVEMGIINQALLKITVNNNLIDSEFFINLFRSPKFQKNILDNTIGTAIQNIASVKELKKIKILLPPLNEQKRIVEEIEKRFAVADEVEKVVEENIEKAKQLKQSILKKAFEGRLVPQDPTDEPASILLEKIKQERNKNDRNSK